MKKIWLCYFLITILLNFSESLAQSAEEKINRFLSEQAVNGSRSKLAAEWTVTSEHESSISGIHHIYFIQTINEIPVIGTESSIHMAGDEMVSSSFRFSEEITNRSNVAGVPGISALDAVITGIRSLSYPVYPGINVKSEQSDANRRTTIDAGLDFLEEVEASLIYRALENEKVVLCWEFLLMERNLEAFTNFRIDAQTGEILETTDELIECRFAVDSEEETLDFNFDPYPPKSNERLSSVSECTNCYEVIPLPFKNPYETDRSVVETTGYPMASPYGWHDINGEPGPDFYSTAGNNTDTFVDFHLSHRPYGGTDLDFTGFEFSQDHTPNTPYFDASGTNLFYLINKAHDIFYLYGFDEKSGNFQMNNYGRGGVEGDWVSGVAQSRNRCNATFSVRPDGQNGWLFSYVCNGKDGAFDATAVLHEYAHGLIRRLVGGANDVRCTTNRERGEEGYCDWFGMMLTMEPTDTGEMPIGIANYLFDLGEKGAGIRPFPYTTDLRLNDHTYESTREMNYIHHIGSVWGAILWEVTWALIEDFGFDPNLYNFTGSADQDAGNIMALAIMTEGLKLMPCKAGFVESRDAILRAGRRIYGDRIECALWRGFAKRGLGINAEQGNPEKNRDNVESFELPPQEATFGGPFDVCSSSPIIYGQYGGNPFGGVYSGPGVTDDGNGITYTFNPRAAGIGTHTITYTLEDSDCTVASTATGEITVLEDVESPVMSCPERITLEVDDYYGRMEMPALSQYIGAQDNCTPVLEIVQTPKAGDLIEKHFYKLVEFNTVDEAGNTQSCSSKMYLTLREPDVTQNVQLHPNPSHGVVYIDKQTLNDFYSVSVFDVRGRLVRSYDLSHVDFQTEINIESLDSGLYFLLFDTEDGRIVKRILRE